MIGLIRYAVIMAVVASMLGGFLTVGMSSAEEQASIGPAHLVGEGQPEKTLRVLSAKDANLYQQIFDVQERADWREADKLIKKLTDPILIGHVQYQRYMHPTGYRSKYKELKTWLSLYADHPGNLRVYKLAMRRKPANWKSPSRPITPFIPDILLKDSEKGEADNYKNKDGFTSKERNILYHTRRNVQAGYVTKAFGYLQKNRKILSKHAFVDGLGYIARGYFRYNKYQDAMKVTHLANKLMKEKAVIANWWGGLAAFKQQDYKASAHFFHTAYKAGTSSDWLKSATAVWAARAYLRAKQPQKVNKMLALASDYSHTFYGLIAARSLNLPLNLNWQIPDKLYVSEKNIMQIPAFRRAIALLEARQQMTAELELRKIVPLLKSEAALSMLALTKTISLPHMMYNIGKSLQKDANIELASALYPVLDATSLRTDKNHHIDKALIFAFIRQESAFNSKAKSHAGARGLMQLMPATASFIGKKRFSGAKKNLLYEHDINLDLGQKYIRHLLDDPNIGGNLLFTLMAYNAGPGLLKKWRAKFNDQNDPLLFIESIPVRETRAYIEKVMANIWIYRHRFAQKTPSLDALVRGEWPYYVSLDSKNTRLSLNQAE